MKYYLALKRNELPKPPKDMEETWMYNTKWKELIWKATYWWFLPYDILEKAQLWSQ